MIHQEVCDFSSFSRCLENCPESCVLLTAFVAHLPRHPIYLFCLHLGVMPRVSNALHLPVAFDDITR